MMLGKKAADKKTRGIERGRWTMQGHKVEVSDLQPIDQCDREMMKRCNDAAEATGRQHDNADDRMPPQCSQWNDVTM
jgi:hypothetical protein